MNLKRFVLFSANVKLMENRAVMEPGKHAKKNRTSLASAKSNCRGSLFLGHEEVNCYLMCTEYIHAVNRSDEYERAVNGTMRCSVIVDG